MRNKNQREIPPNGGIPPSFKILMLWRDKTKILSFILLGLVLFIMPVSSFAQDQDSNARCLGGPTGRGCPEQKTKDKKIRALGNLVQAQINRTQKAIDKLSSIITRIDTHLSDLKEKGTDISSVEPKLASAAKIKSEAQAQLASIKEKYGSIDSSKPRESAQAFMKEMRTLKNKLIELHKALKSVIAEIKNLRGVNHES